MIEDIEDGSTMSFASPVTQEHHAKTSGNMADGVSTVGYTSGGPTWSLKGYPWMRQGIGSARQHGMYDVGRRIFASSLSVRVTADDESKPGEGDGAFFSVQIGSRVDPYILWVDILPAFWKGTTTLSAGSAAKVLTLSCTGELLPDDGDHDG